MKEIKDLDVSKASQESVIPTKIINEKVNISSSFIENFFRQGTQYRQMSMIEKLKKFVDKEKLLLPFLPTYSKLLNVSHTT